MIPCSKRHHPDPLQLALADGSVFHLISGDTAARRIITGLSAIMQLQAATRQGRPVVVMTQRASHANSPPENADRVVLLPPHSACSPQPPLVCELGKTDPYSRNLFLIQLNQLALSLAQALQSRAGILVHGALAAVDGQGVVLAGPGTVGKSTASRRLPPGWRSLSDDATLIVRDNAGRYWGHPWPTWSRLQTDAAFASWDVQAAVPLRGIFFLNQSPEDRVARIRDTAQVVGLLLESAQQVGRAMTHRQAEAVIRRIFQERLAAAQWLAEAIPAYWLHLSLTGQFWRHIEHQLPPISQPPPPAARRPLPAPAWQPDIAPIKQALSRQVVMSGSSMYPTLRTADVLEVAPLVAGRVRRGDVVQFAVPGTNRMVAHRVVAVNAAGIRTRGDNSPRPDPYLVQSQAISGRVTAAWRGPDQHPILGGWRGWFASYARRASRHLARAGRKRLRRLAHPDRVKKWLRLFFGRWYNPRVVAFQQAGEWQYKLLLDQRMIGFYDSDQAQWVLDRPYRWLQDVALLPHDAAETTSA